MEKIVGSEQRIKLIAVDLVTHWEAPLEATETHVSYGGQAMIVCVNRRIHVDPCEAIRQLQAAWHSDPVDELRAGLDKQGVMKFGMTAARLPRRNGRSITVARNAARRSPTGSKTRKTRSEWSWCATCG